MLRKYLGVVILFAFSLFFMEHSATVEVKAAEYPAKPIQIVIPYAPGGSTDVNARLFGEKSQEYLGQPMVVVNKPGAGGVLGMDFVAKSKPDGYTLALGAVSTVTILRAINPGVPYHPVKDFTPICQTNYLQNVILVRADSPLNTLEKLVDYAKKNPEKLKYGTPGYASTTHITAELFQREAGIQMVHVPHKGDAPALMALLGGHIDLNLNSYTASGEQIKAGKVIALAVTASKERFWALPDIPSISEKGYPGTTTVVWQGIVGPAGLPEPIVNALTKYFQKVLASPDVQNKLKEVGTTPAYTGPVEMGKLIRNELDKYTDLAKKANIKME